MSLATLGHMTRGALVALVLIACGGDRSAKDIAESHRKTAEPILAQVAKLAPVVAAQAPITTDGFQLPAGVTLDFIPYNNKAFNTGVAYAASLADPCGAEISWDKDPAMEKRIGLPRPFAEGVDWLRRPACLLAGPPDGTLPEMATDAFAYLEKVAYVLVIRPTVARHPSMQGMTKEELDTYTTSGVLPKDRETFVGGRFAGDVLLYELATAKFLGGFAFAYESAAKVEVGSTGQTESLGYDLLSDAKFGMIKQIMALAPSTNIRP